MRQHGRVVSMSDSQSAGPGCEPLAGFVLGPPEFKFLSMLVNSHVVAFCQLGFLILLCCI